MAVPLPRIAQRTGQLSFSARSSKCCMTTPTVADRDATLVKRALRFSRLEKSVANICLFAPKDR